MNTEKLHFRIGLAGTYWQNQPEYKILVNGFTVSGPAKIRTASSVQQEDGSIICPELSYVEFDHDVAEGNVELSIRLENKTNQDTVENEDKTAIIKDMLLNIRTIEIDEIDLGNLIYSKSIFIGDDPHRPQLDNCVDLGWNGTWTLKFESPFYIWLLENI